MDRVADRRFGRFLDHLGQRRMGVDRMSDLICRGLKGHSNPTSAISSVASAR